MKNVQTFILAAKHLSFVKSAELLQISQPSVTARIKALEMDLGRSLFIRRSRSVQISREGSAFLPYALSMVENMQNARDKMKSLSTDMEGKISIGATALWSVYILPCILGGLLQNNPGIEIKVISGNTKQIGGWLLDNQVDLALVSSQLSISQIKQFNLKQYEMLAVCSSSHPFAETGTVNIQQLLASPIVTYEQKSDGWKQVVNLYEQFGASPNVVMELNQIEAAKELISASHCLCFLPSISVEKELRDGRLLQLKVNGMEKIQTQMSMVFMENKQTYPLMEFMINILKDQFKQSK